MSTRTATASSGTSRPLRLNSSLAYVFAGLIIIFGLIAAALVANACFQCMLSLRDPSTEDGKEEKSMEPADVVLEIEPEIVVIMAGDDHPTYVAKPSHPTLM
ncbi:hypothetical protein Tsubulata_044437 [Turnera subulata]|uniref:Uncharacterized protein n=1 Tax=Turnera subulata TaxID=218843 RepID=A0A9Q0JFS5_9ROSI|nr:hypothetical protein Tsubulata_044437 [Turnera subulata]